MLKASSLPPLSLSLSSSSFLSSFSRRLSLFPFAVNSNCYISIQHSYISNLSHQICHNTIYQPLLPLPSLAPPVSSSLRAHTERNCQLEAVRPKLEAQKWSQQARDPLETLTSFPRFNCFCCVCATSNSTLFSPDFAS